MITQARTILKTVFGFEEFRPLQEEIIENILKQRDTLVIMPTGGGKSLCYQIPALILKGLTVVVSPLISLMKDQVEQLTEFGINAVCLNSTLSYMEYRENIASIMQNKAKMLYLAPETLLMQNTLSMLSSKGIDCLTIDEAHCISEWGHDFRPEYRKLIEVRNQFPKAICVALTATATPRVQEDIKKCLSFEASNEFIASFNRKNLFLKIAPKNNPFNQTIDFINKFPKQSGIIYCLTRRQVDEIYEKLFQRGFSVKAYHAGLSDSERHHNQEVFIKDDVLIMVATIAFGMGINKPNVRFIIHYDLPKNIESYYQQIGRAGRDGLKADCLLLYSYGDIHKIKYFINQKDENEQRIANYHLNDLIGFVESPECRRIPLLNYFGENYSTPKCEMCDNCLSSDQKLIDITIHAQKFLSCVKRTGERFGVSHIIDVLRGSKAKKVINYRHDNLSTYGIGMECSKKQWLHLSRQFLQKGLMKQDMEFGSLILTKKAWEVFRGKEKVLGRIEKFEEELPKNKNIENENEYDNTLFEILRQKRKEIANKSNVPPYIIFPDKTLIEMSSYFPQSSENLLKIHGVGSVKFEKYGEIFLDVIIKYCQENQISQKERMTIKNSSATSLDNSRKLRHIVVGEEFNSGKSLKELLEKYSVKPTTMIGYLYKFVLEKNPIRCSDEFISFSNTSQIELALAIDAFDRFGSERLKPVYEALNEELDYDKLNLLRLYYLSEKND